MSMAEQEDSQSNRNRLQSSRLDEGNQLDENQYDEDGNENDQNEDNFKQRQEDKKKRRTRKDQLGRNYVCPCGKSYLSYPALYTHTKTKHQGVVPKPGTAVHRVDEGVVATTEQPENKQPINQTKQLLNRYFPVSNFDLYPTPPKEKDLEYMQILMEKWQTVKNEKLDNMFENLTENITTAFGRYLYELKPLISQSAYLFLSELINSLMKSISEQYETKDYCEISNMSHLVQYFNIWTLKQKSQKLGSPLHNSILCCRMLHGLGLWLYQERYTNIFTKFNS